MCISTEYFPYKYVLNRPTRNNQILTIYPLKAAWILVAEACWKVMLGSGRTMTSFWWLKLLEEVALEEATLGDAALGEAARGEANLWEADLGETTLGEAALGDATSGEEALGEAALGETTLGEATLWDRLLVEATREGTINGVCGCSGGVGGRNRILCSLSASPSIFSMLLGSLKSGILNDFLSPFFSCPGPFFFFPFDSFSRVSWKFMPKLKLSLKEHKLL